MRSIKPSLLKLFFSLVFVESIFVLSALVLISSDVKSALFFGYSASRLILAAGVIIVLSISFGILTWLFISHPAIDRAINFTDDLLSNVTKRRLLAFICGLIGFSGVLFFLTPAERIGDAVYQRVLPVIILATVIVLQVLVFQFIWRGDKIYWDQISNSKRILIAGGIVLAFFISAWVYIAWSGLGIKPEASGWLTPGTPILAQQVLFAWMIGVAFIFLGKQLDQYKRTDIIIALLLWIVAGLAWWLEPMRRWGYFTPTPTPPNFEYYPHSDAALYDIFSQNLLIGASRDFGVTIRPLYSIFLAFLHAIVGQKFEVLIALQVFILAVAPALVYLLALKFGGRSAGVIAAGLMILREKNSIALTNVIEVSHTKLLMSDLPTMTLLIFVMVFLIYWLQDKKNRMYLGVLTGAFFGLMMLVRSQTQLLIPVVLLSIIVAKRDGWKSIIQKSLVFIFGIVVIVVPWVWRNYQVSGRAVIEYQEAYTRFFAGTYVTHEDLNMLPDETVEKYDARMMSLAIHAVLDNPQKNIKNWFSYFIHNEILSITYLPMGLQFKGLYTYVDEMRFWSFPKEQLPFQIMPIFFLTLFIISLGIGNAFDRVGVLAFAPLLIHFVYNFSVTFVHISGWRFILPVDWVMLLYFSIGLAQISIIVFSLFSKINSTSPPFNFEYMPIRWEKSAIVLALFAVIGMSFPLFESSSPELYPAMNSKELIKKYIPGGFVQAGTVTISASEVVSFLETDPSAVIEYGRALYPAYYKQGKYWGDAPYLAGAKQYNRLEFMLIGARSNNVYIPTETVPEYFPHASNVFIVGCNTPNAVRALAIRVNDKFITTLPWRGLNCSTQ